MTRMKCRDGSIRSYVGLAISIRRIVCFNNYYYPFGQYYRLVHEALILHTNVLFADDYD